MLKKFFALPAAPGILLFVAAVLSLIVANSAAYDIYNSALTYPIKIDLGLFALKKNPLLLINDGLMAIFFLLVGLEIKREVLQGHLSSPAKFMLPAIAALGGLAAPALIYYGFNMDNPVTVKGWAIPAATDIAFALGVMTLLGSRVPAALKVTLVALAVIDDLAAIIIIALFYTSKLSLTALGVAAALTVILFILNRLKVTKLWPYMIVGTLLWLAVLKSGIHATLAGVVIGLMTPMSTPKRDHSPLVTLEHILHPWVSFAILPLFAFANAGVSFGDVTMESLTSPVTLGIALGLLLGKQIGVMLITAICKTLKLIDLPKGTNWKQYYGMSLLTGIGFTMSLFIGNLAFTTDEFSAPIRIGVLGGSVLAGILGYAVLYLTTSPATEGSDTNQAAKAT